MAANEIVDPSGKTLQRRRRTLLQIGGPLFGVVVVVAVILGISLRSYLVNRAGVLELTRNMLFLQEQELKVRVSDYLAPAPATAEIARDILAHETLESEPNDAPPRLFLSYAQSMLKNVEQVESFYLADEGDRFWFVGRIEESGAQRVECSHLVVDANGRHFHRWIYDTDGKLLRTEDVDATGYYPAQRPWYKGAMGNRHLYWADPYALRNDQSLVVTASTRFNLQSGHTAVFAINLSLSSLSEFLRKLNIGKSGRAMIVDGEGHVVAGEGLVDLARKSDWDFARMTLDPAKEPVFSRMLSMYHVLGAGPRIVTQTTGDYMTIATPIDHAKQKGWVLLLAAPEKDFASFTRSAGRQNLLLSGVVVALAAALAGFLIRQNRRTEHVTRVLEDERAMRLVENGVLGTIAAQPDLFNPEHGAEILSESLARVGEARRVSFWRLVGNDERLLCEDAYDSQTRAHSTGLELSSTDLGTFVKALLDDEIIESADAAGDERLRAFQRLFMRDIGTRALLLVPISANGKVLGVVALEEASRAKAVSYLAAFVGGVSAVRFAAAGEQEAAHENGPVSATSDASVRFEEGFMLAPGADASDPLPAGRYPMVSVATVVFGASVSRDFEDEVDLLPVVQKIAGQVQEIAREHHLFSAQAIGNRLLLIGGCGKEPDHDAVLRLADAVLAIREVCINTLADADLSSSFRIGMDVGPAIGAQLGEDPAVFNIWGDSVQISELLADSMPDTATIQVSESAYTLLRDRYLFRPRGKFYLPRSGVTRSFIMAGRR